MQQHGRYGRDRTDNAVAHLQAPFDSHLFGVGLASGVQVYGFFWTGRQLGMFSVFSPQRFDSGYLFNVSLRLLLVVFLFFYVNQHS